MDKLTFAEQLRVLLKRKDITMDCLAGMIGVSRQNLSQQMKRDNFREKDMHRIAEVLDCDIEIAITPRNDTGSRSV